METKIDINAAVNFIFEDKEWVNKIVIAGFLYLTIIGALPVLGWTLEIQRRVINEEENPLPDWSDIGAFTLNGLKIMLVNFIYTLPVMLFLMLPLFLVLILPAFMNESSYFDFDIFFVFFNFVITPVSMVFFFLYYALIPIITGLFVETNSIKQAFKLSRIFHLVKANYLQLLGVALLAYVASYAAGMLGMLLCFVGMFFTTPIGMGMTFHLFGQAYRNSLIKLDEAPAA